MTEFLLEPHAGFELHLATCKSQVVLTNRAFNRGGQSSRCFWAVTCGAKRVLDPTQEYAYPKVEQKKAPITEPALATWRREIGSLLQKHFPEEEFVVFTDSEHDVEAEAQAICSLERN